MSLIGKKVEIKFGHSKKTFVAEVLDKVLSHHSEPSMTVQNSTSGAYVIPAHVVYETAYLVRVGGECTGVMKIKVSDIIQILP